nr:exonuclease mut-7 homolog [Procambarus clarkii]
MLNVHLLFLGESWQRCWASSVTKRRQHKQPRTFKEEVELRYSRNMQGSGLTTLQDYSGCFVRLQHLFKDRDEFSKELQKNLAVSANPYKMSLVCVKLSPDLYKCKSNSMAANILVELQNFLNQESNKQKFESCLSVELQKDAFQVAVRQKNTGILRLLVKVYQMINIKDYLLPFVKELQTKDHLKEVCTLATLLSLQSQFTTQELIMPLFLQDRLSVADEFLDSSPSHQKEILVFIDKLIGKKIDTVDLEKYKIKDLKKIKSSKVLCNVVARLLKRFALDSSVCPHFKKHRATGGLRFLFYKYYIEKGIQKQTFFSLVDDTLKEHPDLKIDLMYLFIEYCDPEAALPYVTKLQIAFPDIPRQIKDTMSQFPHLMHQNDTLEQHLESTKEEEIWDTGTKDFYPLSVPCEKVVIIDTIDGLERCTVDLLRSPVIGMDSEWKPTFGLGAPEQAALLQLATTSQVFLLDLVALQPIMTDCHWHPLCQMISNSKITKLGYGIKGDFRVLGRLNAKMREALSTAKNLIDFDHTKGILLEKYSNIFSYSEIGTSHKGLSDLVYRCFGSPLNKSEQFSNWAARPLTKSQILYAATDARCLIDIYEYLNWHSKNCNIPDWQNIKKNDVIKPEKKKKTSKQSDGSQVNAELKKMRGKEPNIAADFKFVCDTMVQGLAKKLRSCGINTEALDNGESCDHCIEYYEKEKRVVLTRGVSYTRLCKYIPAEFVYCVQSEMAQAQLAEIVKVFNIKVTVNDVFARCSKCNSPSYICVPSSVLLALSEKKCSSSVSKAIKDEWVECQGGHINLATGLTKDGVMIQVEQIPDSVLQKTELFYVCCQCGKCYWEGSHHNRIIDGRLKDIIEDEKPGNSVENCQILRQMCDCPVQSPAQHGSREAPAEASIHVMEEHKANCKSFADIPLSHNELSASSDVEVCDSMN